MNPTNHYKSLQLHLIWYVESSMIFIELRPILHLPPHKSEQFGASLQEINEMIHHWMTDEKEMRFHKLSCILCRVAPASREQAVLNTLKPPRAMKRIEMLEFVFRCAPMIECLCAVLIPPAFWPVFTMPTVCSSGWAWDLALQQKIWTANLHELAMSRMRCRWFPLRLCL